MKTNQWMKLSKAESNLRNGSVVANHIAAFLASVRNNNMTGYRFRELYNSLPDDKSKAKFIEMIELSIK